MTFAVSHRRHSPTAIGLTSPLGLGIAMRRAADKSLAATSGIDPLATRLQTEKNISAEVDLLTRALKCSNFHPDGPEPKPLGSFEIVVKNSNEERSMGSGNGKLA
jgi:hypothetical protein